MSEEIPASESEGEEEQVLIVEAQRAEHAPQPPHKKRRLNNSQSKPQPYQDSASTTPNEDNVSDSEREIKSSDQNSYQINVNNNKKRRKRHLQSQSRRKPVYKFGNKNYNFPLTVNPGAIVRLKLENFLCHDNFEITFHPFVNIIHGQNGSGKSAIEAGISMALGQNSKKTGRGNKLVDVIQDGKDWSKITLYLYNEGPERLEEYGSEIIIERRLSKTSRNGYSSFKVIDGRTLKTKATGLKPVRNIADKFNLNVENPCVILKQTVAKKFLNTSSHKDKFKFFMQASKLGNYVNSLQEARVNVESAKDTQRATKGSFVAITKEYWEAKEKLDTQERYDQQKEKVEFWKRSEKWMVYHKEKGKIHGSKNGMEKWEYKIRESKKQLEEMKKRNANNIKTVTGMKQEIEEKSEHAARHKAPVAGLKKRQAELDKERHDCVRKINAKHKYVDKSRQKIQMFTQKYQQVVQSIQNNERGRQLASISEKLIEYRDKLTKLRTERDPLREKTEKTIPMKENEASLVQKQQETYNIQNDIEKLNYDLQKLNDKRNSVEKFLDPSLRHNRNNNYNRNQISIYNIRQVIQRHKRRFDRLPIGPLGEYINMQPTNDQNTDYTNTQIVQTVLGNSIYKFLCDSTKDQKLFGDIMKQQFGKSVPCIQYRYSDRMEQINHNPFSNNSNINDPLIRVSDMFSIKDNNPWVYNAILTNSQPERAYAHGDLQRAKAFLNELDSHRKRVVNYVITYREQSGFYRVEKRGNTVSGTPCRKGDLILQKDTSVRKQWYQNELNTKIQAKNIIDQEINQLKRFVDENNRRIKEYENKLMRCNRGIRNSEEQIERLQRQQTDLQEEEEGNDALQSELSEYQNSIEDEKQQIAQFEDEIKPSKDRELEIKTELSQLKLELNNIECKVRDEKHQIDSQRQRFQDLLALIQQQKTNIQKIPIMIQRYENGLKECTQAFENEKQRINGLFNTAKALGDEITPDLYPRNPANRNRQFSLIELKRTRNTLESEIEAWENQLGDNDEEEIRKRYEMIKPKYEQHNARVDNCNFNCDEMTRLLNHRTKEYNEMKDSVKHRLSLEFRFIMKQQAHDGGIEIDYRKEELKLDTKMITHDGNTQVRNTKTLSGGERSFSQIAFIMALQKFSGSPFCIYDEFDVFMDSVNRGNSIKILLQTALGYNNKNKNKNNKNDECHVDRQYIFITPNDVSPVITEGHKDKIRIHQLKPPRRNK